MLSTYGMFSYSVITSEPYSRAPDGNRRWRYRVVDLSVAILGHPDMLRELKATLEGAVPRLKALVCF